MRSSFNEYMEEVKSQRIRREQSEVIKKKIVFLKNIYEDYLTTLRPDVFYPNTADICQDWSLKRIIFDPTTPDLSAEQLRCLFPNILTKWREPLRLKLIEIIESETDFAFDPYIVLDLASTTFYCRKCSVYLSSQQTMVHSCARTVRFLDSESDSELIKTAIQQWDWNSSIFIFKPRITEQVGKVLQMCFFDPTITVQQLEQLDPIFECLDCHNAVMGRYTLKWSELVGAFLRFMVFCS